MYQYSLTWYIALFIRCIAEAPKGVTLDERLKILNEYITYAVYCGVCRSLFEKDKLLFSFSLCIAILMSRKEIDPVEFRFLLTGGLALDSHGKVYLHSRNFIFHVYFIETFVLVFHILTSSYSTLEYLCRNLIPPQDGFPKRLGLMSLSCPSFQASLNCRMILSPTCKTGRRITKRQNLRAETCLENGTVSCLRSRRC